jgi:hypothetical protein
MEIDGSIGPARVAFNVATAKFEIPDSPHFSEMTCRTIYKAMGNEDSYMDQPVQNGAAILWGEVVSRPLSSMKFSA